MGTVWRVVDDTDDRIEYSNGTTLTFGNVQQENFGLTLNTASLNGDVFNNTVHVATSFKFRFNGTSLAIVYGTVAGLVDIVKIGTQTNPTPITPNCLLDGKEIPGVSFSGPEVGTSLNNQMLCSVDPLSYDGKLLDGEHEISFNVTNSLTSRFFVDYIVYEALDGAPVDGDVLQLGNDFAEQISSDLLGTAPEDPLAQLTFGSGWSKNPTSTNTPGSSVTVKFNGTAIQLYGDLTGEVSNLATVQLDDQVPQPFTLSPPGTSNKTNQLFFNRSSLNPGVEHTVVVTHNGSAPGMPLTINYFLVTSLTAEEQASLESSSTSIPIPTSSSPNSPSNQLVSTRNPKDIIIGSTIGGVVFLGLVALLVYFWTKRRRNQNSLAGIDPFVQASTTSDFDPYNEDSINHSEARKLDFAGQQQNHESSNSTTTSQNGELNMLRLGILKLQQRLAIQPRSRQTEQSQAMVPVQETRFHTDSGWRMRDPTPTGTEIPPSYTEM
ncbi:hypothetical protein K435DRAFT_864238 [Dendrothele bispora CBS 962.96]|uniref:Uncharacterized protein n=1 Tax=Dendrothele bispora (strain CBS 962.96) TaxID=1314807 RepID=A0A4S8LMF5_DENBC|nr:hypothetical protein K435DRAFT_864238 [Dendrothele bispora CBS 962.96]